jgi:hypothetical protein
MAIEFKSLDYENTVTIGGTITANTDDIISGPFPRYSISKEVVVKDTLYIGDSYTINVTGTALITGSGVDMLTPGARQNALHQIMQRLLEIRGQRGVLIIEPYGGLANKLQFDNAKLVSVELPEQTDTSQGTQSQEYAFVFEATILSNGDTPDVTNLKDVSETWEFGLLEGEATYLSGDVYRNFTITHTLSATGNPTVDGTNATAGYVAAKNYVNARLATLGDDPFGSEVKDFGKGTGQQRIFLRTGHNPPQKPSGAYNAYNQVNSYTQDVLEGTFSATRTWLASRHSATVTVDVTDNKDSTAEFNTVEVSVNIQGHETAGPNDPKSTKYANALAASSIGLYSLALGAYSGAGSLRGTPRSQSTAHSETAGTIALSASFDDAVILLDGTVSSNITITDNNHDGGNKTVAIIAVIARAAGPIIQDMGTTNERTKTVALEAQSARVAGVYNEPTGGEALVLGYAPDNGYRQNFTKSWNPQTGRYSVTADWVYTG